MVSIFISQVPSKRFCAKETADSIRSSAEKIFMRECDPSSRRQSNAENESDCPPELTAKSQ